MQNAGQFVACSTLDNGAQRAWQCQTRGNFIEGPVHRNLGIRAKGLEDARRGCVGS